MPRAPFQVLIYPYRRVSGDDFEYALLKRADTGYWQAITGGGEDSEIPLDAARREAAEEAGLPFDWLAFREACDLVKFDGSRTALWELNKRFQGKGPRG